MSDQPKKTCIACRRSDQDAPLIAFTFQDKQHWICTRHLPQLIHEPAQLVGKLPGAETLEPADDLD